MGFRHASHICTSRGKLTHGMVLSRSHGIPMPCVRDAVGNRELRRGPVENVVLAQLCMHPAELQAMSSDS